LSERSQSNSADLEETLLVADEAERGVAELFSTNAPCET
jgi:hypothetical protein